MDYTVGEYINHVRFGLGRIIDITDEDPQVLVVDFDGNIKNLAVGHKLNSMLLPVSTDSTDTDREVVSGVGSMNPKDDYIDEFEEPTLEEEFSDERPIVSFACSGTYDLVNKTHIHVHPIKKGYPTRDISYLMVRALGGYSEFLYKVVDIVEIDPLNKAEVRIVTAEHASFGEFVRKSIPLLGYRSSPKPYRFYILKPIHTFDPPFVLSPNPRGYIYLSFEDVGLSNMNEKKTKLIDLDALEEKARKFSEYVHAKDNNHDPISFKDPTGILFKEEGYKEILAKNAREILKSDEWDESWIGSGRIKDRIYKMMSLSQNIVNFNGVIDFKNRFDKGKSIYKPDAERAIYEIYRGNDEEAAFDFATTVFGAKYPLLAYLFFVKDETRFLPTTPTNFERCFKQLNIDFTMAGRCSWENYSTFLGIIREFKELLPNYIDLSHELSLLDAHSFVWIVGEDVFMNWNEPISDINTPLRPKSTVRKTDGTIRIACGRCGYLFIKASRCPECGQLVKE